MTLAPPHGVTDTPADGSAPTASTVTAVLVLRGPTSALAQTLDSLARQTRSPERLVVVDPGLDGLAVETVRVHEGVRSAIPSVQFVTVPGASSLMYAVRAALAEMAGPVVAQGVSAQGDSAREDSAGEGSAEHVWVLTCDTAAAPTTLARLLDAIRRSPSVGAAGPKQLDWHRPGILRSVGVQMTRSGRVIPAPAAGEPDQGQYDRRSDVLAVPTAGMLAERALLDDLGWHDRALGEFGSEVDFGWRAQAAGRRVVVVPRATIRTGATPSGDESVATARPGAEARRTAGARRRQTRRVALARCAGWALPFLAAWIAVSSVVAGAALLLAKRPRAAWAELADLGALLTPGRIARARWGSRGRRRVRRRDLAGLFVRPATVLRHTGDLIHDQVTVESAATPRTSVQAVESGPVADDAEDLNILGATWASRAARNPGLLVTLTSVVVAASASRDLGGTALERFHHGLTGGELTGVRADPSSTWHAWWDGWHGAGFGAAGEQSPALTVLAALSWLVSHLPLLGTPDSPLGAAVAVLVGLAIPLATLTAYLGARVITHARWPRALAALAWATTAALTSAAAGGRLAGVVAAVLLPLVAAGCVLAARRRGSTTGTAATVLAAAVLASFVPVLLAPVGVTGLALLLVGRGPVRWRGLALAIGPIVLLGPWLETFVGDPAQLLTGPGLSVWGEAQAEPWQIALLHPGGPGSTPVMLGAVVVAAGVLGLVRPARGWAGSALLGLLALLGTAAAIAAPRLQLGVVPAGDAHAGAPITAWAGTGVLVAALALLASALRGADGLRLSRRPRGVLAVLGWPMAVLATAAVLAGAGFTAWQSLGSTLGAWSDPRPAVAIDQAESGLGNRMLLLAPDGEGLSYELVGREPAAVARALPGAQAPSAALAEAVGALFASGAAPGELHPARDLSTQAVGFVGLRVPASDPRVRTLDSTAGLSRLGDHEGVIFWRVLAGGGTGDEALAPSRARLVTARSAASGQVLPVAGDHSRLDATVIAPVGTSLVLAEPPEWVRHGRVTANGRILAPSGDGATYPVPAGQVRLAVDVLPTAPGWRYAQAVALLLCLFLALPFGNRASRRAS